MFAPSPSDPENGTEEIKDINHQQTQLVSPPQVHRLDWVLVSPASIQLSEEQRCDRWWWVGGVELIKK